MPIYALVYVFANRRNSRVVQEIGSRNTTVPSNFRRKVTQFRACALKNMQYNLNLWPNYRNSRVVRISSSRNTIVNIN